MQSGFARDLGVCMGMSLKWYRKNDAGFDSEYAVRVCAGLGGLYGYGSKMVQKK